MDYNIIGYGIFICIIGFIIIVVGRNCYRNGNIFVAELIPGHLALCRQINKVLLIGYYLLNIGYCALTLADWATVTTLNMLVEIIAMRTAIIICMLSILHYINIIILTTKIQKLIKTT